VKQIKENKFYTTIIKMKKHQQHNNNFSRSKRPNIIPTKLEKLLNQNWRILQIKVLTENKT